MKKAISLLLLLSVLLSALPAMADDASDALYKGIRGTTVSVHFTSEPTALQQKQIRAFELKYGCKVEPFIMTWNDWKNQFLSLVVSGNVPDVTGTPDETYLKWLARGLLQPVDDYINADDPIWNDQVWDAFMWKGDHYGFSSGGVTPIYVVYNATLFYEKGVKTPLEYYEEGKWNFKNFRKCAIEMTGDGVIGCGTDWKYIFALANGSTIIDIDKENGKLSLAFDDEKTIAGQELCAELAQGGYFRFGSCFDVFANGELAMFMERPTNVIGQFDLRNTTLANSEIEIVPMPIGPDNDEGVAPAIFSVSAIPRGAKNPLGGAAWIYYRAQYSEKHKDDADVVENRRKTYTDEQYEFVKEYEENTKFINTFCYGVWYTEDWNYWADMFYNGYTPQTAFAKYESEFQHMLDSLFVE
ncbi:MAG: extracellular solute-binding protein [Clostridiales bacterium]|nr:extracellular solute-binding protein [Clostridiales bacterium]